MYNAWHSLTHIILEAYQSNSNSRFPLLFAKKQNISEPKRTENTPPPPLSQVNKVCDTSILAQESSEAKFLDRFEGGVSIPGIEYKGTSMESIKKIFIRTHTVI
jgi:hypothetical protein